MLYTLVAAVSIVALLLGRRLTDCVAGKLVGSQYLLKKESALRMHASSILARYRVLCVICVNFNSLRTTTPRHIESIREVGAYLRACLPAKWIDE
jgi:hypothetical protein